MLKFYFGTVVIWAFILNAAVKMWAEQVRDNGWLENAKPSMCGYRSAILSIAAIPVFRLVLLLVMFYMAGTRKE